VSLNISKNCVNSIVQLKVCNTLEEISSVFCINQVPSARPCRHNTFHQRNSPVLVYRSLLICVNRLYISVFWTLPLDFWTSRLHFICCRVNFCCCDCWLFCGACLACLFACMNIETAFINCFYFRSRGDGLTAISARPYANHFHLAREI